MTTRRQLITLVGGAAAWPVVAHTRALPVIGVVRTGSPDQLPHVREAFHRGLGECGFVENQNVLVEYRWAEGRNERMPELLDDLVRRKVSIIAVLGSTIGALAAKAATKTIPVVFMMGSDPIELGLVSSLAHPGGNLTGVAQLMVQLVAKRLEILHQLTPKSQSIALLINPTNPFGDGEVKEVRPAAEALKLQLHILRSKNADEIDIAFATLTAQGISAVLLSADALFVRQSGQIAIQSARYNVPVVSHYREFPVAGGLMSYGSNLSENYRLAGVYVGGILNGESPADLPVMQPTKFEFVINLRTAKSLGLVVPDKLLALADEVVD